ncbi:MAG: replication-relaxation family protein [Christensenellales bacterium]
MQERIRISSRQLETINRQLSERDKTILEAIRKFRYLTTVQIWQLYFNDSVGQIAAHRAANRALAKLSELGLITALQRRIGGVRAGSGSYVWCLGTAGIRLLNQDGASAGAQKRKRHFEPSLRFLEHTLAISETYVQLSLIKDKYKNVELHKVEVEPDCWKPYIGDSGTVIYLKPDLYIVTTVDDYEDHWFFEIDLATESPSRILVKCQQYYRYYQSDAEQRTNDVFPLVVWIASNEKRVRSLRDHIADEFKERQADIFLIITPDQLERLINNHSI